MMRRWIALAMVGVAVAGCADKSKVAGPREKKRLECEKMAKDEGYKKFTVADYFLSSLGFDRGQDAGLIVAVCMKAAHPTAKAGAWPQLELTLPNQNEEGSEQVVPHLQEMLTEGLDTHGL